MNLDKKERTVAGKDDNRRERDILMNVQNVQDLKPSKFNYIYLRGNEYVVFNTFSKALILMDEETIKILNSDIIKDNNETIKLLKDNGFLVEADFDENNFLKYYNNKARFSTTYFSLTIAPSLKCNFDCPYCFENKREGTMSREIQEAIIDFVKQKIENGVKIIEITWYGGEPLLQFSIIRYLCERINELCKEKNVKCKMGMISNGYLLTEEIVSFLEKYNISFQVTLDGMEKNHDKRRYLKNGLGTFERIANNLRLFEGKNVDVYVRMNVDNYNQQDYPQLSEFIDSLKNKRMILYPAVTEKINERKKERQKNYMTDSSYDDFISITRKKGLFKFKESSLPISNDVGNIPNDRCYFCAAELENSCVIDDKGNVYKCWDEVGHEDYCFNILRPNDINYQSMLRYMGDNVFDDEKCSSCTFLPICFGGCKFHRYHLKRYACAFNEDSVKEYIEECLLK